MGRSRLIKWMGLMPRSEWTGHEAHGTNVWKSSALARPGQACYIFGRRPICPYTNTPAPTARSPSRNSFDVAARTRCDALAARAPGSSDGYPSSGLREAAPPPPRVPFVEGAETRGPGARRRKKPASVEAGFLSSGKEGRIRTRTHGGTGPPRRIRTSPRPCRCRRCRLRSP